MYPFVLYRTHFRRRLSRIEIEKVTVSEPSASKLIVLHEYLMNAVGEQGKKSSIGDTKITAFNLCSSSIYVREYRNSDQVGFGNSSNLG